MAETAYDGHARGTIGSVLGVGGILLNSTVVYADGRLYYRNEGSDGPMVLVEVNPTKYIEHGRFEQPKGGSGPCWPHPVIANGKLYLRHADVLYCYDVKQH